MKELLMMVLSLCLLVCMTFISRADAQARKKEDKNARRAELLKKYDKNGDGKLDESERMALKEDRRKSGKAKDSELKKGNRK